MGGRDGLRRLADERDERAAQTNAKKAFVHNNWVKLGDVGWFTSDVRRGRVVCSLGCSSILGVCVRPCTLLVRFTDLFALFLLTIVDVLHHFMSSILYDYRARMWTESSKATTFDLNFNDCGFVVKVEQRWDSVRYLNVVSKSGE